MLDSHSEGIDLVAMCVNDVLVHGAEPLFFLDYFATGKLEVPQALKVIEGVSEGCRQAGCALVGGETAEMPGMYAHGDYDVAGFAVAAVERTDVLPRTSELEAGDVLIGIASSGVHSNGFSLCRKILASNRNPVTGMQWSYLDSAPFDKSIMLGEALLTPTKIYVASMLPAIRAGYVLAAAHITGGGLFENLPRVLPDHLKCHLSAMKWEFPALFRWLMSEGGIACKEMARTFNCGLGMVLVVKPHHADACLKMLSGSGERAWIVGHMEARAKGEEQVAIDGCLSAWGARKLPKVETSKLAALDSDVSLKSSQALALPEASVALVVEEGSDFRGCFQALAAHSTQSPRAFRLTVVIFVGAQMDTRLSQMCNKARISVLHILEDQPGAGSSFEAALGLHEVEYVCWKKGQSQGGARREMRFLLANDTYWQGRVVSDTPSLSLHPAAPSARAFREFEPTDLAHHELVLRTNCRFHGITVHLLVSDTEETVWPVLWQEMVEIDSTDTAHSLAARVTAASCEGKAYVEALKHLSTGLMYYKAGHGVQRRQGLLLNRTVGLVASNS